MEIKKMARFTNTDRFGNQYTVIGFKPNKNGYPVGYWESASGLYKLELSNSNKDGVSNWLKITKLQKRNNNNGGRF